MTRNAGRARARKGERKDIVYTCKFLSYFLASSILRCFFVFVHVGLKLVGHEDIEQIWTPPLLQFPAAGGIFLLTIPDPQSQTHCPCVRVYACVCGRSWLTLARKGLYSPNSPWGLAVLEIESSNKVLEMGSRHYYFGTFSKCWNKLTFSSFCFGFLISKTQLFRKTRAQTYLDYQGLTKSWSLVSLWKAQKRSETGLKPVWNTFPPTISYWTLLQL